MSGYYHGVPDLVQLRSKPLPLTAPRRESTLGRRRTLAASGFPQYAMAVAVVALVTLGGLVFTPIVGAHATALVFLLAVVFVALVVDRGPTLLAAALSALSWDFFFLPPLYAFRIRHFEDAMLFAMYFVVALVLGQLTARIRAQEAAERRRQEHATALFLLARELGQAAGPDELAQKIVRHTEAVFSVPVAFVLVESDGNFTVHPASTHAIPETDRETVLWVLQNRQIAGRGAKDFSEAAGLYVPITDAAKVTAVLGLHVVEQVGFSVQQLNLLSAFSDQISLALARQRLNEISEKARLLAESERLSKTLLDSMSHEMRTPIAAIRAAANNLAEATPQAGSQLHQDMVGEIEQATERLDRLVGNVLEASRLESGSIRPRTNECDVAELIHVAVADTEQQLVAHKLTVHVPADLPIVRLDFVLVQQVLTNLLSNAAIHTPPGTRIELTAAVKNNRLIFTVADNGPGVPVGALERIFDKFYRGANAPTGGTGLGLSLVKGFVEAHHGTVNAQNRAGGGALFTVSLPLSENN